MSAKPSGDKMGLAGSVRAGSLERWFEDICRIKHTRLAEVVVSTGTRIRVGVLPRSCGVYGFWWTGDEKLLRSKQCSRKIGLVGPGGNLIVLQISSDRPGLSAGLPIPLFGQLDGSRCPALSRRRTAPTQKAPDASHDDLYSTFDVRRRGFW